MAIVKVTYIGAGQSGGSLDDYYRRTYEEYYRLYFDSPTFAPGGADLVAAGLLPSVAATPTTPASCPLPQVWSPHPADPLALCKRISWKREATPDRAIATLEYGSDPTDITRQNPNPLLRPPEVDWNGEDFEQAVEHSTALNITGPGFTIDLPEEAIANSASDFYEATTVRKVRGVLTVTQNFAAFDETWLEYGNKVNMLEWRGYKPLQVYCRPIKSRRDFLNNTEFWPVTFTFVIGEDLPDDDDLPYSRVWFERKLDCGQYYFDPGTGLRTRFADAQGRTYDNGLLDGEGGPLDNRNDPVWNYFPVYGAVDLNLLPISMNF